MRLRHMPEITNASRFPHELSPDFPAGSRLKTSEIDQEGFGAFRDVVDLRGTTVREARTSLAAYRRVLEFPELGAGALAYALFARKAFPAASCRSHVARTWAPPPVAYLVSKGPCVELLRNLMRHTECDFDPNQSELLLVAAPSLPAILEMAQSVVDNLAKFRSLTLQTNRSRSSVLTFVQPSLLDG